MSLFILIAIFYLWQVNWFFISGNDINFLSLQKFPCEILHGPLKLKVYLQHYVHSLIPKNQIDISAPLT